MTKKELDFIFFNLRKCRLCGDSWYNEDFSEDELLDNKESIEEDGRCLDCREEWGLINPDF